METSALNLAHEKQRRAEALLREGKFEEAAKCHEIVADLLTEAHAQLESSLIHVRASTLSPQNTSKFLTPTHSLVTLESLNLQRDYHKRQAAVVRMKQAQYEEYKTTLENHQKDLLNKHAARYSERDNADLRIDKFDGSLRQAIYKTIDEQDSLLTLIDIKLPPSAEEKSFKHPKDTGTVIEELKTVNSQLRSLVGSLLSQLEAKEEEVRQLTERLYAMSVNSNDGIRAEEHPLCLDPLPPLTPLEMPLFDFSSS
ncbi:nuclear receptor-binding factor 2-like isoform X1 [Temnothorax curvispinosus]|uniref:Nuclear receptor-binding factor 2-like isoform X1 n=1 Tax=Temnothorax curvispinosus TaxID=300111 RepID=A0A6J1R022_9HYME|nr:nuclear receptor-binding factor 2-like isoform X1 [Temnothorax curvispinosus]